MVRVLLVDDDPLILRLYQRGLTERGLLVETAVDGVGALTAMHACKPDVLVLDLMMPRLSGPDVLKLMKSQPDLEDVPVVVLSNCYMDALANDAAAAGAQKGLLKTRCTPQILYQAIRQALGEEDAEIDPSSVMAASVGSPAPAPTVPATPKKELQKPKFAPAVVSYQKPPERVAPPMREAEVRAKAREEFLGAANATCASLRSLFQAFNSAPEDKRLFRLQDVYRKVHFMTATAGLSECHRLAQMSSVFEAMLFQMMDQPSRITPSVLRTTAMGIDFLHALFQRTAQSPPDMPLPTGHVLVVDDDPVCTRLVLWALQQAQLHTRSTGDPYEGLQMAKKERFDLILLDIVMPGMDGFEFCRRVRALPDYDSVAIIHFTSNSDFQTRTQSALSGSDDFIAKPVMPMELAVKAVMHLIERYPQS